MQESCEFNFFEADSGLDGEIYLHGISQEIKEILSFFGGVYKTSKFFQLKSNKVKEWASGRRPISVKDLKMILENLPTCHKDKIMSNILKKEIQLKVRRSPLSIRFPKKMTKELAYLVGLIIGDGHLAGTNSNKKGNWRVGAYFDNLEHLQIYQRAILQTFNYEPKFFIINNSYCECCFASKAVHWFLRTFFELKNGAKANIVEFPKRILTSNEQMLLSFISGLFDSDGTVVVKNRTVKYASTSQKIVQQLSIEMLKRGFNPKIYSWKKAPKYKTLYTLRLKRKHDLLKFAEEINLLHPLKRQKINAITKSICIAP